MKTFTGVKEIKFAIRLIRACSRRTRNDGISAPVDGASLARASTLARAEYMAAGKSPARVEVPIVVIDVDEKAAMQARANASRVIEGGHQLNQWLWRQAIAGIAAVYCQRV